MNFLDYLNLGLLWTRTYSSERSRWKSQSVDYEKISVYYGYENILGPDQNVFGGIIKLQDLQLAFPNETRSPRILYLISSALPRFPVRMAKMAKKVGVKLIINQNGVAYPGWHGKGWESSNRPIRELHQLADYVIYQSHFCKRSSDTYLGVHCPENEILYNPVDTGVFCPATEDDQSNNKRTLLLAGSHMSFYRPQVAIKVLQLVRKQIDNVQLTIAGNLHWHPDRKTALRQLLGYSKEQGVSDKVNYVGPYTQKQALPLFRSCSLLLHTKYNDPCPRLVVEAMACGLPVVYSATGGVPELVGSEAGRGVQGLLDWERDHPPDPQAIADEVLKVLADLSRYSRAARNRVVQKFDVEPWILRHNNIFEKVLNYERC